MIHPSLKQQLSTGNATAEFLAADARSTAEHLVDVMQTMHGGEWRAEIDHARGFILIAPRLERTAS